MKNFKNIFLYSALAILMLSCFKGERKVVATYEDSKPFIIEYVKKHNNKEETTYKQHLYPNGKTRCEGEYIKGKRKGIWKFYYEDGSLFAKTDFSKTTEGSSWQIFFDKDSLLVNKNDELLAIGFSNEGIVKKDSLSKETKEGTPVFIKIKRNKNEIYYRFFNSFKIMEKITLKGNIPNGQAISWYENGNMNSIRYYLDGMEDSTYTIYAENGQKILTGTYNKGKKIGKWEYFSKEGQPLGFDIFDNDGTKLSSNDNQGLIYSNKPEQTTKEEK